MIGRGCQRCYRGGGSALFKNDDDDDTRKDREKDSRSEIQLITTEAKEELNWVQNPNNSQRERERTKRTMNERIEQDGKTSIEQNERS
jgi:hypothetical protein